MKRLDEVQRRELIENPFNLLVRAKSLAPKAPALISAFSTLTFEELYANAINIAAWLRTKGVRPGDIVAVDVQRELRPILVFAIFHEAAVACFPGSSQKNLSRLNCRTLVTTNVSSQKPGVRTLLIDGSVLFQEHHRRYGIFEMKKYPSPESLVRLSFSSGSTGEPKAIPVSVFASVERFSRLMAIEAASPRHMTTLGDSGATTLSTLFFNFFALQPFLISNNASQTVDFINQGLVETLQASPIQIYELLKALRERKSNSSCLKEIFCSGGKPSVELARVLREEFGVKLSNWFGASETGGVAYNDNLEFAPESFGKVLPGVEVKVVDNAGDEVAMGTEGQLLLKSSGMAKEYVAEHTLSKKFFIDGWFVTGDLAKVGPGGAIELIGRQSEVINIGGVKVKLEELDEFALRRLPVQDAASFVSKTPEGVDLLCLAFVPKAETDPQEIISGLRRDFAHAVPNRIFRVETIPRNEMGKPLRRALRDLLEVRA